ncbi:class II glutamine amidotransferase [Psychrobacter pacificensis]|uniref:class II glutamine amidotransferase n=1 Tax=Psychrobacter pacificensis TaxID=112002 RepID=UPI003D2D3F8B
MCQLLGMNCNTPTDIGFSFAGFRKRGGMTDSHEDGFGIAFFERSECSNNDKTNDETANDSTGLRLFHDNRPSHLSPVADLVNNYPIKAMNVIAHIRKATQGQNCLANTHPFVREVWGEQWVFAHNGQMNSEFIKRCQRLQDNGNAAHCQPVGSTDSEMAFCYLVNRLKSSFKSRPDDKTLFNFLTTQCRYLSANGLFNCLISNGRWQLAYAGSLLFYLTRQAPFGEAKLADDDMAINFSDVTTDTDKVTILVTVPLTENEKWQQLAVNECLIFQDGDVIYKDSPSQRKFLTVEEGIAIAREVGASV